MMGAVGIALILAACPARPVDPPALEEDHTATCEAWCTTVHSCATEPHEDSESECVESCREASEGVWHGRAACDELADTYLNCLAELTCAQYAVHESNLNDSECYQASWDYSVCLGEDD